jgi:hypothetical protein
VNGLDFLHWYLGILPLAILLDALLLTAGVSLITRWRRARRFRRKFKPYSLHR